MTAAARLGTAFLLACAFTGCTFTRNDTVDRQTVAAATSMLRAIGAHWSPSTLSLYADPDLYAGATPKQMDTLFSAFRRKLGPIRTLKLHQSSEIQYAGTGGYQNIAYLGYDATFQKARGQILLTLRDKGRGWAILSFRVNSEAFMR